VNTSKGETGLWTGGVTFSDATSNTSTASGMVDGSTYTLTWTIFSKYKECAASSKTVKLDKLKNITTAKISTTQKDYCEATSFSILANAADALNFETGEWISTDLTIPVADKNATTLPLSNLLQGTYTITWKISSSLCPGGSTDAITISVDKKPAVGTITSTPLCEESDVAFTAAGFTSIKTPNYVWSAVAAPSTTSADKATYKVASTATTGATDGITVKVDATNSCGTTTVDTVYTFNLRPRNFAISFTSPILKICASDAGPVVYNVTVNPALPVGTDFNWYWNNEPTPKATSGASYSLNSADYISKTGNIDLEIRAHNQCGEAKATDNASEAISVEISQSKKLEVTIKAELSDSVCVADPLLNRNKFIATPVTNGNTLSGTESYTFTVTDTLGTVYKTSTNTTGIYDATDLSDGDVVAVELTDATGCFDAPRKATADTVVNGFSYPNSTIINAIDTVCESHAGIKMKVLRTKNRKGDLNDAGIKWYKDRIFVKDFDSTRYEVEIGVPDQTGTYTVEMKGSVCPDSTTQNGIKAKIYELPAFEFPVNPFVIVYLEGIVVPMPIVLTKPVKDPITNAKWISDRWLTYPIDTVHPNIVPEREQVEINYNLSVSTGPKTLGCTTERSILVINSLPLNIPNAFSPNGDGVNDTWVINGLNKYTSVTVSVFNRWGNRVFYDNSGYKEPFDGTINGVSLATGTYYAILELKGSPDNTDQNVTRSLTIVR
jgi:gliding motility-associated-like protein